MATILESVVESIIPGMTEGVRTALPYLTAMTLQGTSLSGSTLSAIAQGGIAPAGPRLSANEIIRRLRSNGFSVRTQIAKRTIATIRRAVTSQEYVTSLPGHVKPLASKIAPSWFRQEFKYYVRVGVTGLDRNTGELRTQWVTVTSPRLLSINDAKGQAALIVTGTETYDMVDITGIDIASYTKMNPALNK